MLLLDALKGAAAYGLALLLGGSLWALLAAALGMMLGHWFPCWLRFRGGVGQAPSTGFLIAMWPLPGLAGIALFGLGRLLFRPFNMAYGLAALGYLAVGYSTVHVLAGHRPEPDAAGLDDRQKAGRPAAPASHHRAAGGVMRSALYERTPLSMDDLTCGGAVQVTIRTATPDDFASLDELFLEGDRWHTAHEPTFFRVPADLASPA